MTNKNSKAMEELLNVVDTIRLDDKVSLIFLLGSTSESSLRTLGELLSSESNDQNGVLKQFLLQLTISSTENDVYNMTMEALAIIKNHRVYRLLNLTKGNLDSSKFVGHVNTIMKQLYNFIETLTEEQTCSLISSVTKTKVKTCRYLEQYILDWQLNGILSSETESDASCLAFLEKYINLPANPIAVKVKMTEKDEGDNFYAIVDQNELGYCIILNNNTFTRNVDYPELLPPHHLKPRPGSDQDVKEISKTFQNLNFKIKSHENVNYKELRELLNYYSSSVLSTHSCILIAVMSHGTEDVFYTADSIPVSVEALEMAFQRNNCPQLTGKPKILIIQACQGKDLQRVMMDGEKYSPGLNIPLNAPERGDALIAWSTVKGYASFRDIYEGSWFIQELCKELQINANTMHLVDIVTRVNHNLRNKTYNGVFMVPSLTTSLCKKFKFIDL